ncbi:hypothetical protein AAVH_06455 [Aphelenchoides avenae]|nr:hypothetical protein AAVH_06455 [Aphelenchus avenae]
MTLKTTLSPELFDHPTLYGLYHTFLRCTLVLSSLLFPFTLYMIYTQSPPQLRTYSVYLSVQLSWAYAFRVSLTVTELVPLFPLLAYYSRGPLTGYFTQTGSVLGFYLVVFTAAGMCQALVISAIYRISRLLTLNVLRLLGDWIWFRALMNVAIFIGVETFILAPAVLAYVPPDVVRQKVFESAPFLRAIVDDERSIVGFESTVQSFWIYWFIYQIAALILAAVVTLIAVNLWSLWLIRRRKSTMSKHTLRLNMTLYRAMSVQMIIGAVLLLLPAAVASTTIILELRVVNEVIVVCLMIASTHATCEMIAITYFVHYYRRFVLNLLKHLRNTLSGKHLSTVASLQQRSNYSLS